LQEVAPDVTWGTCYFFSILSPKLSHQYGEWGKEKERERDRDKEIKREREHESKKVRANNIKGRCVFWQ